ncbi:DUF2798 domain-containing protein [Marinomonas primoryensis]|jgi:hypothetical protein|uniref:DUF2798 domain-containing protein n=1 Tax=Marinomonas primoryensis TaxID=178399 RepID=A0ABV0L4U3_9GAMM|tara:strand:+ start:847 stop:1299 length:453 start_codon:yes stop_codon:yes gene_type:complete
MSLKVQKISIVASLVIAMGGTLTFLMTWRNIGFADHFMGAWLSSFALCVLCIAPIGGILSYLVHHLVNAILPRLSSMQRNIVFGLIMAIIMESVMAVVTTINLYGFLERGAFLNSWTTTLMSALPAGIVFSILMSIVIKPKLTAFWAKTA